jgi:prophage tail gpP-like protein
LQEKRCVNVNGCETHGYRGMIVLVIQKKMRQKKKREKEKREERKRSEYVSITHSVHCRSVPLLPKERKQE